VGYLDRFGGIQELPVSDWIRESTDEEWIPQHRIRYFKKVVAAAGGGIDEDKEDEVVWHRDERIDKVFGSTQLER
jgi:MJ1316 RNA cyclic group end recognition domain